MQVINFQRLINKLPGGAGKSLPGSFCKNGDENFA